MRREKLQTQVFFFELLIFVYDECAVSKTDAPKIARRVQLTLSKLEQKYAMQTNDSSSEGMTCRKEKLTTSGASGDGINFVIDQDISLFFQIPQEKKIIANHA